MYGESVATATMHTPVIDIIKTFAELNISAVPIIDEHGIVFNMYDTIDVMVSMSCVERCIAHWTTLKCRAWWDQRNTVIWIYQWAKRWKQGRMWVYNTMVIIGWGKTNNEGR